MISACKETEPPPVPVSVAIIGLWKQIELREDGQIAPLEEYFTMNFAADNSAVIKEFDETDAEIDSTDDNYELKESSTLIDFDIWRDLEIVSIDENELVVEYRGQGSQGVTVDIQEKYQKQ